ncbi:MAG: hypothetical protein ACM31E_08205 [Fibrobacterota bacterium]|nr:hypothetical protein [Chitinispirillaceae bacterium]
MLRKNLLTIRFIAVVSLSISITIDTFAQNRTEGITNSDWANSLKDAEQFNPPARLGKTTATTPSKVDNSRFASFRPIFNQRGASCAQASGIGYLYTYEINYARGISSQIAANQYPYDYTYNFLNDGDSLMGSTTTQGWNIVRATGIPNVVEYGGFGLGKFTQWISGYNTYYSGLKNKLKSYFSISVRTQSDIDKTRQWIYNHATGSSQGGLLILSAYADGQKIVSLPSGTPDAGRKVITGFGTTGGHAMTIVGYNDSIRYDYNKDGKYTTTIDLNADGVIDVRDWEIGGVIMVNSWGTRWADSGRAYIMYKVLADSETKGGIFSNQLIGIYIDQQPAGTPSLVCKVILSHDSRENLRLKAGYSTTITATRPSISKTFGAAFNYAGGAFPVQGVTTAPIETALDISDYATASATKSAAFFVTIESMSGSGKIHSFSLFDYSVSPAAEYRCLDTGVTINTSTTTVKLIRQSPSTSPTAVTYFVNTKPEQRGFYIYNKKLFINAEQTNKIRIYRIDGSLVHTYAVNNNQAIDISGLCSNRYIIKSGVFTESFTIQ